MKKHAASLKISEERLTEIFTARSKGIVIKLTPKEVEKLATLTTLMQEDKNQYDRRIDKYIVAQGMEVAQYRAMEKLYHRNTKFQSSVNKLSNKVSLILMKKILLSAVFILNSFLAIAQQLPNRYIDEITQNLQVTKDIPFSTNIPTVKITNLFGYKFANEETYGEKTVTLKMDIFEPETDDLMTRPVLIFAFGGGFVTGKRNEESIVKLCEAFARRGFVTASIDYRLGMNIGDEELAKRAVYRALQDGRSAVRFFRKNATKYNVDPNQIYISGHSAGAFLAYHTAYLDKESERPASTRDYFGRADLGQTR